MKISEEKQLFESNRQKIQEIRAINNSDSPVIAPISYANKKLVDLFRHKKEVQLIKFDELIKFNQGERQIINDKVQFEKIESSKYKVSFLSYIEPGGSFELHWHDCIEIVEVVEGNLLDRMRPGLIYNKGMSLSYAPGEKHKPYSLTFSIYKVTFISKDFI